MNVALPPPRAGQPPVRRMRRFGPVPIERGRGGSWMWVTCDLDPARRGFAALVDLLDERGEVCNGPFEFRSGGRGGVLEAIAYAGARAASMRLTVLGRPPPASGPPRLSSRQITRLSALRHLVRQSPDGARRVRTALLSPRLLSLGSRLRALGLALAAPGLSPRPYADWLDAFETWTEDEPPGRPDDPVIGVLLFSAAGESEARRASIASLAAQWTRSEWRVVEPSDDLGAALQALPGEAQAYVGILQAGELLPAHGLAAAAAALRAARCPELAIADEDATEPDGTRTAPDFRPTPNLPMMLSGVLARGLWLVRRDILTATLAADGSMRPSGPWAECARLALWLSGRAAGRPNGVRIPHVLSSRRADAETAPVPLLADVASDFLRRAGLPFRAEPAPDRIRLRHDGRAARPSITAIVPSTLVASHAERCLDSVMDGTDYPGLDMLVALSGPAARQTGWRAIADRLGRRHRSVRLGVYPSARFNFAETVNRAAADVGSELLLLLNDDVTPIDRTWLAEMAGWFADPRVAAVGARLLYPDRTIQHGGVLIGPATLCHHAFLGLDSQASDLPRRASLPQQLLAVTGACLLVRTSVWRGLGGMDENYPSGFNDIDLCLRISEGGGEVVLADTALIHEESKTFGSHWSGERAAFHRSEVQRMQRRWQSYLADDPFYNPNLDLFVERAWQPAWPPRRNRVSIA